MRRRFGARVWYVVPAEPSLTFWFIAQDTVQTACCVLILSHTLLDDIAGSAITGHPRNFSFRDAERSLRYATESTVI